LTKTAKIGVVGATGYTGIELCRLLADHPSATITHVYSRQYESQKVGQILPHLHHIADLTFERFDAHSHVDIDVLFLALPHGQAHEIIPKLKNKIPFIIDLSADFRLQDPEMFKYYYSLDHGAPDLIQETMYGLPELYRDKIKTATIIANPGCYPTCAILGLHPIAKQGWVQGTPVIDAKSGVSGAGRGAKESSLFCEVAGDFSPYGTGTHRHTPEMTDHLGISVLFSPHLVPMSRGMQATMYVDLAPEITESDIQNAYVTAYKNEPFVHIVTPSQIHTRSVAGTNHCFVSYVWTPQKLIVFSMIDNLIKGASGQAIQNMNILLGIDETTALRHTALWI
jgi:N-acetyl-gamma-glutamyl-phosphate reductase